MFWHVADGFNSTTTAPTEPAGGEQPVACNVPMVWLAAPLMAGLIVATTSGMSPRVAFVAVALSVVALVVQRLLVAGIWPLAAAVFFLGLGVGGLAPRSDSYRWDAPHYSAHLGDEAALARMVVRLDGDVSLRRLGQIEWYTATGDVRQLWLVPSRQTPASGRINLRFISAAAKVAAAEIEQQYAAGNLSEMEIVGTIRRPRPPVFAGAIDRPALAARQGIAATIDVQAVVRHSTVAPSWLSRWRAAVRQWLGAGMGETDELPLLRRLLLGESDGRLQTVEQHFRDTGTAHLLAISGQHVALLAGFVYLLARLMNLPPRWTLALVLAVVVLYGAAAVGSPPVWRAVVLSLLAGVAVLLSREVRPINLLAAVLVLLVVLDPRAATGAGFQLTFACVAGLMLLTTPVVHYLRSLQDVDLIIADGWMPHTPRAWRRRMLNRYILPPLAASVVAFVVSVPITAWHFSSISLYAVPATIVMTPIVTLALLTAVMKVALTALIPPLAGLWAVPAEWSAQLMSGGIALLAALPDATIHLPRPPWWAMVGYYSVLLVPLGWPARQSPQPRLIRPGLRPAALARAGLIAAAVISVMVWPARQLGGGIAGDVAGAIVVLPGVSQVVLINSDGQWHTTRPTDDANQTMAELFARRLGAKLTPPPSHAISSGPAGLVVCTIASTKVIDLTATSTPRLRELLDRNPLALVGDVLILHPRLSEPKLIAALLAAGRPVHLICGDEAELPEEYAARHSRYGQLAAGLLVRGAGRAEPVDLGE